MGVQFNDTTSVTAEKSPPPPNCGLWEKKPIETNGHVHHWVTIQSKFNQSALQNPV